MIGTSLLATDGTQSKREVKTPMRPKLLALLESVRRYRQQWKREKVSVETVIDSILSVLEVVLETLGEEE